MNKCELFKNNEQDILRKVQLKKMHDILLHHLVYNNEFEICSFIQLFFEDDINILVTTGSFADDLKVIDETDFLHDRQNTLIQNNVKFKTTKLDLNFELINESLLDIECVKKPTEEYYWKLNFIFKSSILEIHSLIDEVGISVIQYK